ncbi:MAG: HAD-IIA family hydrolase [Sporichthyaceae bacterium]
MSDALRRGCAPAPAHAYDAALLDLDGVLYVGLGAVAHAAESLEVARAGGMRLAFVTNNAARTPQTVAAHLSELGIPAKPDEVATSAQAAVRLVAELVAPGSAVLVVGGDGLREALLERGLRPVSSADDDPAAVVQGYHPTVGWPILAEGAYAVARGIPWIASNTDRTVPTPRGIAPGNGTLVEVVRMATGRDPVVAGKPELALHRESAERVDARRPLVVGDRLDTDVLGANRAGVDSLLVLTGVHGPADLLAAAPDLRPTLLAEDLRGLLVEHAAVEVDDLGVAALGGWRAGAEDGRLWLDGAGTRVDAVRVACTVVWATGAVVDTSVLERLGHAHSQ